MYRQCDRPDAVPQIQRYTFLATNLRLVEAGSRESAQSDRTGREVVDISDGRVVGSRLRHRILFRECIKISSIDTAIMSSCRLDGPAEVEGLAISRVTTVQG